jgi:hypothetical protein
MKREIAYSVSLLTVLGLVLTLSGAASAQDTRPQNAQAPAGAAFTLSGQIVT